MKKGVTGNLSRHITVCARQEECRPNLSELHFTPCQQQDLTHPCRCVCWVLHAPHQLVQGSSATQLIQLRLLCG